MTIMEFVFNVETDIVGYHASTHICQRRSRPEGRPTQYVEVMRAIEQPWGGCEELPFLCFSEAVIEKHTWDELKPVFLL